MKKVTVILICLIVLLVILTGGVYAMTSVPQALVPNAKLKVEQGTVQIKKAEANEWKNIDNEIAVLQGDSIKTLENSKAQINFFDNSRVALDSNTEITLQKLYIDSKNFNKNQVGIRLQIGRIWNRIINLLDKDSAYEVATSSTVATVRGTAFSSQVLTSGEEETDVTDGMVKYFVPEKKLATEVKKDTYIKIDPKTVQQIILTDITKEKTEDPWFKDNTAQDEAFLKEVQIQKEMAERQMVGIAPQSLLYPIKIAAEQVRTAITFDEQQKHELEAQFANRRLIEAKEMIQAGNSAEANKLFDQYQKDVKELQLQNPNPEIIQQIQQQFIDTQKVLDMNPEQAKMLNTQLQEIKQVAPVDLKMIEDARAETIKAFETITQPTIMPGPAEPQPIQPIKSTQPGTIEPIQPTTSGGQTQPINSTIKDLENFSQINDTGTALPSTDQLPKTTPPQPINTSPTIQPAPSANTTQPIQNILPKNLEISAPRTNMSAGESLQLNAYLIFSDASKKDVTVSCLWTLSGDNIGSITNGGFLQTVKPGGTATITASYTYEGQNYVASKEITALSIEIGTPGETNW